MQTLMIANLIFFSYLMLYTPMKRFTTYNTLIGALVGALPPYLGWVAAGGSLLSPVPFFYFSFMCSWQLSHFYGIL